MAKVSKPLFSLDARGTLANSLTHRNRSGLHIVGAPTTHPDAHTWPQWNHRLLFLAATDYWATLSAAQRSAFRTSGSRYGLTAYQYFLKQYLTSPTDIAALWHFNEATGLTAIDSGPNSYDLTIVGASHITTPLQYGLQFDGLNNYCRRLVAPLLGFTSQDFTLLFRATVASFPHSLNLFCRGLSHVEGYNLFLTSTNVLFLYTYHPTANRYAYANNAIPALDTWYTIAATKQGDTGYLYRDGQDITTFSQALFDPPPSNRHSLIGIYDNLISNAYSGDIDLVIIFNRALSPTEHANWHTRLTSNLPS